MPSRPVVRREQILTSLSRRARAGICGLAVAAAMCCAGSAAHAATIIKLDLGGVGPDVGTTTGGVLGTVDDSVAATAGNQNTAVEYTGFLNFIPDIATPTASFTLSTLTPAGLAQTVGSSVIQNYAGGTFSLFDPNNVLLLSGALTNSQLTGTLGAPGTGAVFSTSLGAVTGGTLAPLIQPGSISLSMALTNVNGGNGFSVGAAAPVLQPFVADASLQIAAEPTPEPATFAVASLAGAAMLFTRRRHDRGNA